MRKTKRITNLISLSVVVIITMVLFVFTAKAQTEEILAVDDQETLIINALIFADQGQLVPDGDYTIRFSLYTTNRLKIDSYPSDKDQAERVWTTDQQITIEDGKLKTTLVIPKVEYNKYYLGVRINQDNEMVPRKLVIIGEGDLKKGQAEQEAINEALLEAVGNLQAGTSPGNIPILNEDGKIDRSLLDIPAPAGSGGVEQVTITMNTDSILMEITNNLLNNNEFTTNLTNNVTNEVNNNLAQNITSDFPEDGNTIIYNSSTNEYISTVLELELLKDVNLSSVDDEDILVYDEGEDEWVNKSLSDLNGSSNHIAINDLTDGKTGGNSVFLGSGAGANDDGSDNRNTGVGIDALHSNTTGIQNTANGYQALYSNTTGDLNTANGLYSLRSNTIGNYNVANGLNSLFANTTGSFNVASGLQALFFNTTGNYNVASGAHALSDITEGFQNTAIGYNTGRGITTGDYNTILGANVTGLASNLNNNIIIADGAGNIRIQAVGSGAITFNGAYTFPTADGTSGQVLQTDGSGALSWNTPSGGVTTFLALTDTPSTYIAGSLLFTSGSAVTQDNANLFWDDTNNRLGIGDATPSYELDVNGKIGINGIQTIYNAQAEDGFTGSLIIGDGGTNLSHTAGSEGYYNTFVGIGSGEANTSGYDNVANGFRSLYFNTTGSYNTATGGSSLYHNTIGYDNTANGMFALYSNTTGNNNTATGVRSLNANITGNYNTANGHYSLYSNSIGNSNTANGFRTLQFNTSGYDNTANGTHSLRLNTTGNYNTAIGMYSLDLNTTGSSNTALGFDADTNGINYNNVMVLGAGARVTASNRVRIGNTLVTRIGGQVGWSNLSDARMKENIEDSSLGLDFINKLRPVTFNFKEGQEDIEYTGLIAQEVERSLNELGTEFSGLNKPANKDDYYSLGYASFITPLIKATQEQQKLIGANTLKTDTNIVTLEGLQTSVDKNLTIINQTLTGLQTTNIELAEVVDSNTDNIATNTEGLDTLATNIDSLTELTTTLTDTTTDHELRIVQLEELLVNQGVELDTNSKQELITNPDNPQIHNLVLADTLQAFSDSLTLIQEDSDNPQQIFSLSGDLIVERLKAKKIEAEEIEVAGATTTNVLRVSVSDTKDGDNASSIGSTTILAGETSIIVETTAINKKNSKIILTPRRPVSIGAGKIVKGKSFEISISSALKKDLLVDWVIIEAGE